jgi:hypothetical protein
VTVSENLRGRLIEAGPVAQTPAEVGGQVTEKAVDANDWLKQQVNKAQNRADKAAQKGEHEVEVARQDARAKDERCSCL